LTLQSPRALLPKHLDSKAFSEVHTHTTFTTSGTVVFPIVTEVSLNLTLRWKPFDPARNWPDLGPKFVEGERKIRVNLRGVQKSKVLVQEDEDTVNQDRRDLDWATVLKRTFESYIRGERPNMYGEWLEW